MIFFKCITTLLHPGHGTQNDVKKKLMSQDALLVPNDEHFFYSKAFFLFCFAVNHEISRYQDIALHYNRLIVSSLVTNVARNDDKRPYLSSP